MVVLEQYLVRVSFRPTSGPISSPYGWRTWPDGSTEFHKGIDIAPPAGTLSVAAQTGVVTYSGWISGFGNIVIISPGNGVATLYGHMSSMGGSEGQTVSRGHNI